MKRILNFLDMDISDIRDNILETIDNKDTLVKELDHINKLFQVQDQESTKTILWFLGILTAGIASIVKFLSEFGIKIIDSESTITQKVVLDVMNFLTPLVSISSVIFLFLMLSTIFGQMMYRTKLKKRKTKIILQLNELTKGK